MKTQLFAAAMSAALVGLAGAGAANADTITFSQYGVMNDTPVTGWQGNAATPTGESLGVAEAGGTPTLALASGWTLTGSAQVVQGTYYNSAAPAISTTAQDAAPYLSVQANESATLTAPVGGVTELELYIGSLDNYNSLTFNFAGGETETLGGDDLVAHHGGDTAIDGGGQQAGTSNGLWTFDFSNDNLTSLVFGTGSTNAFEIAAIGVPLSQINGDPTPFGIPEPATWGLMLMGLFGAGGMLRSARREATVAS